MNVSKVISSKAERRGISCAELARRTGMNKEVLRRCLRGKRAIRADELLRLCSELEMSMSDFDTN